MKKTINILPNRKEYCLLIQGAFSHDFCDSIIREKQHTFKIAKTHYPTSYRNNERQVLDTTPFTDKLFQEIKNYIPNEINVKGISSKESGQWQLDSLNSRLRICRYLPKQYFNKHLDGIHYASEIKQSKLTFMIYLNGTESFEGGRTLFFNSKEDDSIIGSYKPQKGDLIIFDHNLWHSGEMVAKGEKYILRSDIIYKKVDSKHHAKHSFCDEGHLGYIWTATFFDNNLVTSGRDKKIKIWSKNGIKISELIGHKNSILSIIPFNNKTLISASRDASIKIWSKKMNGDIVLKKSLNYHIGAVLCLCKLNNQAFFSGGADGILNKIAINGNLIHQHTAHNEWIWDIIKINDNHYATISEDGSMKIWDLDSMEEINVWQENIPLNSIASEGNIIILGRFDGTIIKLNYNKQHNLLQELNRKKCHNGIIRRIVLDDSFIYSASEDNTLKIWDKIHFNFIEQYEHKNFVQDVALFDTNIITVSYDGEILKNTKPTKKVS